MTIHVVGVNTQDEEIAKARKYEAEEIAKEEAKATSWAEPKGWIRGRAIAISEDMVTADFGKFGTQQFNVAFFQGRDEIWVKPSRLLKRIIRPQQRSMEPAP